MQAIVNHSQQCVCVIILFISNTTLFFSRKPYLFKECSHPITSVMGTCSSTAVSKSEVQSLQEGNKEEETLNNLS